MNHLAISFALALAVCGTAIAQSGQQVPNEPGYTVPGGTSRGERPKLNEPARSFSGEVASIDKGSRTVSVKHGPIDMLGGTSEYTFKDADALTHFKVGDRVRFNAVLQGRALVVTSVAPN
jgi:Cu/Ag efflux protein CusF